MAEIYDLSRELCHLSTDQLREVLNDEGKFDAITSDKISKLTEQMNSDKELVMASNRSLTEYMATMTHPFQSLKMDLMDLYDKLEEQAQKANSKILQIKGRENPVDAETMIVMLQSATTKLEEDIEKLTEEFFNGRLSLEEFLEEYLSKRKLFYARKCKLEKVAEINSKRSSYLAPSRAAPLPPSVSTNMPLNNSMYPVSSLSSTPYPQQIPYPLGPTRMPMPSYIPNHF